MMKEFEDWKQAILANANVDEDRLVRYWNSGYSPDDVLLVHKAYRQNASPKAVFDAASRCGCFHCLAFFEGKEVEWDSGIAECPHCHIDAVLPETADYKLTPDLLRRLQVMQFTPNSTDDFDFVNDVADRLRRRRQGREGDDEFYEPGTE